MKKTLKLGTSKTYGGRGYSIFCEVELKDGRLSISGVEGPLPGGNCLGSCGQIDMHLRDEQSKIKLAKGWTRKMLAQFFDIWKEWHLNDMQAGCVHQRFEQRIMGTEYQSYPANFAAICPECGYHYGTKWLSKEVPESVREFLASLPEADSQPAWV